MLKNNIEEDKLEIMESILFMVQSKMMIILYCTVLMILIELPYTKNKS